MRKILLSFTVATLLTVSSPARASELVDELYGRAIIGCEIVGASGIAYSLVADKGKTVVISAISSCMIGAIAGPMVGGTPASATEVSEEQLLEMLNNGQAVLVNSNAPAIDSLK